MATRRLDTLLVELLFRGDTKGLDNANRKLRDMDRQVQAVARGIQVAVTAAIGIGTAAFFTGSKTEREFAKFQTQLGDTEEQVEALKPQLRALSQETGQSFERLAAAAFNLKSSVQGISDESYKAWSHVLEWVESSLDFESLSPDPESPELAKLAARVRVGGK